MQTTRNGFIKSMLAGIAAAALGARAETPKTRIVAIQDGRRWIEKDLSAPGPAVDKMFASGLTDVRFDKTDEIRRGVMREIFDDPEYEVFAMEWIAMCRGILADKEWKNRKFIVERGAKSFVLVEHNRQ